MNGVSIPQANLSIHVTFVCVPNSGIPSITGISSLTSILFAQKESRAPSFNQKPIPIKIGIRAKAYLNMISFKLLDEQVGEFF